MCPRLGYYKQCLLWTLGCMYPSELEFPLDIGIWPGVGLLDQLLLSGQVVSNSLWPRGLPHARLRCPSLSPRVWPNSCCLNQCCHPTTSSSVTLFSFCLQFFPASGFFPQWISCLHHVIKVLEFQFQHQPFQWVLEVDFLYTRLAWSPCSPGDSKESFPAPQFEIINSFGALHSLWFSSHIHTWLLERPYPWVYGPL